jgi:hypothetical protein
MTSQDAKILIAEIKKLNPKLNSFELGFMESIQNSWCITKKQSACLMNIYGKAAGGGVYQNRQYGRRY